MPLGKFSWFNAALLKFTSTTPAINLSTDTFKALLLDKAQVISATFTGTSGNCQKSDLTAELATGSGYTNGGLTLANISLTRSANVVTWTSDPWLWTLTGVGISFKYLVIFDDTAANKDLVCFVDMSDDSADNVVATAGTLIFSPPTAGILNWSTV